MRKTWFVALLALVTLSIAVPTRADTMWTLNNVVFTDQGVATGTFTLTTAGVFTAVNITTSAGTTISTLGTPMPGAAYSLTPQDQYLSANGAFLCANPSYTCLDFFSGLTQLFLMTNVPQLSGLPQLSPGQTQTINLVEDPASTVPFDSYEGTCLFCFGGYTAFRQVDPGTLTGIGLPPTTNSVPEPGTLPLIGTGFAALIGLALWKKSPRARLVG